MRLSRDPIQRLALVALASSVLGCSSEIPAPPVAPPDPLPVTPPVTPPPSGGPSTRAPLARWSAPIPTGDSITFRRLAADRDRIYLLTNAAIQAFDAADGSLIWERSGTRVDLLAGYRNASGAGGTLMHATAGGGRLVVSTPSYSVALRGTDGAIEWTTRVSRWGTYVLSQLADAETVYSLADHGGVIALDARTGAVRWTEKLEVQTYAGGSLSIRGDRLLLGAHATLFGSPVAVMADLDRASGRVGPIARWDFGSVDFPPPPIPVMAGDGLVGLDSPTRTLSVREAGTLATRWRVVLQPASQRVPWIGPLAADSDRVYVGAPLDSVSAFDVRSGDRRWSVPLPQPTNLLTCGTSLLGVSAPGRRDLVVGFAAPDTIRRRLVLLARQDGTSRTELTLPPGRPSDLATDGRVAAVALRDSLHVVACP